MKPQANRYYEITASESEDWGRSVAEIVIYTIFVLSPVLSIITAATQPIIVPSSLAINDCRITSCA